jgi:hypothetical protein
MRRATMLFVTILAEAALLVCARSPVGAEDAAPPARGKAMLVEIPFSATNAGSRAISCSVALAHWYSAELGQARPGGAIEARLWGDPKTGEILFLNESLDHMPVQSLWCGFADRSWESRATIALDPTKGRVQPPIAITCAAGETRLACR